MTYTLYIHLINDPPLLLDVDELPTATDTLIIGRNPRTRDGKDYQNILAEVTTVIFPMTRISFIEVMPDQEGPTILPFRD
ncbi:MAG: hypothetical protein CUN49_03685 [Candidatus Thermofonsia Clade 1 bacterium]|jgi:hypothetical protein|uniref:Uncharacterized protein n=1 Tax=Candidatus Thermofonsia Clade 1 bacterium TaxID=2364210 RepID=A0A2M8PGW7_9CHLR|nr:MAG: hypothetical protein CUN49_03685 [Candidatus Thermofonsia Clade 1 bacterium]RMF51885.1 MAG: hypothetical protein D6749_06605 [Chloroflexota bacterium]